MIDELPHGWVVTRLEDLTERIANVKPENWPEKEFRYLDISAIDNSRFIITDVKRFRGKDAPSRARRPIQPNDVLFSNVRTYLRNIALVPNCTAEICSTGFSVLRPNAAVEPRFLFRYVLTDAFVDAVTPQQTGTHYPATSDRVVLSQVMPLPPLKEQRRIVTKVEKLLSKVDASQRRLSKIPVILKRFRQSVLAAACSGRLTADWREKNFEQLPKFYSRPRKRPLPPVEEDEVLFSIPASWQWIRLGASAILINGDRGRNYPNQSEYVPKGIPFINTGHIEPNGSLSAETMHYLTKEKFNSLRSGKIQRGDLVYCLRGATLGKTAFVAPYEEGAIASSLVIIRLNGAVDNRFAFYFLTSPYGKVLVDRFDNGSAQPNLSAESVEHYVVPLPPSVEQKEIVRRVQELFALADQIEARYAKAKAYIDNLTQSILAKAFLGELVPQDPNDEPASVLLERIRQQRNGDTRDAASPKRERKRR